MLYEKWIGRLLNLSESERDSCLWLGAKDMVLNAMLPLPGVMAGWGPGGGAACFMTVLLLTAEYCCIEL